MKLMDEEKKKIFNEMELHLMEDNKPSVYFKQFIARPKAREYPYYMLYRLVETDQSPKYHPEGNVWNHTMMVVDEAAKRKSESRQPKELMWAALLHDIGKPDTTKVRKGKITSYDHDKAGALLAGIFLSEFDCGIPFIKDVTALIRWHMQILHVVKNLSFQDIESMSRETDINEIALLGLCDRLGRLGASQKKEEEVISLFLEKCSQ